MLDLKRNPKVLEEIRKHEINLNGPCFSNDIFEITNDVDKNQYRIRRYLLLTSI